VQAIIDSESSTAARQFLDAASQLIVLAARCLKQEIDRTASPVTSFCRSIELPAERFQARSASSKVVRAEITVGYFDTTKPISSGKKRGNVVEELMQEKTALLIDLHSLGHDSKLSLVIRPPQSTIDLSIIVGVSPLAIGSHDLRDILHPCFVALSEPRLWGLPEGLELDFVKAMQVYCRDLVNLPDAIFASQNALIDMMFAGTGRLRRFSLGALRAATGELKLGSLPSGEGVWAPGTRLHRYQMSFNLNYDKLDEYMRVFVLPRTDPYHGLKLACGPVSFSSGHQKGGSDDQPDYLQRYCAEPAAIEDRILTLGVIARIYASYVAQETRLRKFAGDVISQALCNKLTAAFGRLAVWAHTIGGIVDLPNGLRKQIINPQKDVLWFFAHPRQNTGVLLGLEVLNSLTAINRAKLLLNEMGDTNQEVLDRIVSKLVEECGHRPQPPQCLIYDRYPGRKATLISDPKTHEGLPVTPEQAARWLWGSNQ